MIELSPLGREMWVGKAIRIGSFVKDPESSCSVPAYYMKESKEMAQHKFRSKLIDFKVNLK